MRQTIELNESDLKQVITEYFKSITLEHKELVSDAEIHSLCRCLR